MVEKPLSVRPRGDANWLRASPLRTYPIFSRSESDLALQISGAAVGPKCFAGPPEVTVILRRRYRTFPTPQRTHSSSLPVLGEVAVIR